MILGGGWLCSKLAESTLLPSFTLQLIVGVLLHDALAPLAGQTSLAVVLCTALAAVILKGGADEIDRNSLGNLVLPTLSLAVAGFLITFTVMDVTIMWLGLDGATAALLAAIISSTDPAALIPTLRKLTFKSQHRHLSDVAIAESAINDALGAIITTILTAMIAAGTAATSTGALLTSLIAPANLLQLGRQFLFGIVAGCIGWACMWAYEKSKFTQHRQGVAEASYDFALVLVVPLFVFLLAQLLHGNGFLAAFVTGVLANYNHAAARFHRTLHAMEIKIESIGKPVIFMMMGPFVSVHELVATFWPGLLISAAFMLIARPAAVMLSLLPTRLALREKGFLCAVRETGVIPVVLAVITAAQLPQLSLLLPLTAWVVIWTLGLLPALTPWWAKKLSLLQQ
ncbi:MAG TPA: cation:proton antiporter [Candidatus Acidoferrum sp.]|nr:cation:proton antiporter [Candidatus Acidoferrum sp.]